MILRDAGERLCRLAPSPRREVRHRRIAYCCTGLLQALSAGDIGCDAVVPKRTFFRLRFLGNGAHGTRYRANKYWKSPGRDASRYAISRWLTFKAIVLCALYNGCRTMNRE